MKFQGKRRIHLACALMLLAGSAFAEGRIHNLKAIQDNVPYNGFIVKFRDGSLERGSISAMGAAVAASTDKLAKSRLVDTSSKANPVRPFGLDHIRRLATGPNLFKPSRKLSRDEGVAIMQQLAAMPNVEYVEPNVIFKHTLVPNDPSYATQWGFGNAGIRAEQAWDLATGSGVTVAVLDTGITNHPDLNANVLAGYDFVTDLTKANDGTARDADASDPGDVCPSDGRPSSWHGTHVAGTVAAVTNNSTGVAGTAFNAKIMPVRVLGVCGGDLADIADAIVWSSGGAVSGVPTLASSAVPKVISMSLGAAITCPQTYQDAIDGARARGTTVVAAAGNNNGDAANHTPSNCAGVISVAAVDSSGNKASFSNFGPRVDVSAPGVGILSTLNSGTSGPVAPTYQSYNGTSMATPHVSGVVALIQSRRLAAGLPLFTPTQVAQVIKGTARPLPGDCPGGCGAGIVDASEAVKVALVNSTPVARQADQSGKVSVVVFERTASAASGVFTDFSVEVPDDYVVVGGGVQGAESPNGHFLTASYPNAARSAWLVSTKEHLAANPTQITAWAIGLKIAGLTRSQLLSNMTYRVSTSAYASQPSVTTSIPVGYTQIGGGFQVQWSGDGNLAWASYPTVVNNVGAWVSASKDQGSVSMATIRSHSIGLRTNLSGVGVVSATTAVSPASAYVAHPSASVAVPAGYALTGCGAQVNWSGAGNVLWKIKPSVNAGQLGCEAASKDHLTSSPATINSHAVGIKLN